MSTNLGHKSSGTEVFALEVILNAGYDDESTSESRHKLHISFCFSWLEDLAGEATRAWENCFLFLSTNVTAPSSGSILLTACNGELGNSKVVLEEAQEADEIAGKDPVTHPTDGLLPSESVKVQVGGAEPLKAILLCLLPS